jgi:hypothetical protein
MQLKLYFLARRANSAPAIGTHSDEDDDECEVIAENAINHQQAMDAHEIVDDIFQHTENSMYESGMVMQPDYLGKQEDLYLSSWCLIRGSKTYWEYGCQILVLMQHWLTD